MNDVYLCKALGKFLEEGLSDFLLPLEHKADEPTVFRAPKIIQGYLPPKNSRESKDDDFPFVLIRPDSGKTDADGCSADVSIVIGVWDGEFEGHLTALSLKEKTETLLLNLPNRTLDERFILETPVSWENSPAQAWPFWQIVIGKGGLDVKFRIFALDCGSAGNVDKGIWVVDLDESEIRVVLER